MIWVPGMETVKRYHERKALKPISQLLFLVQGAHVFSSFNIGDVTKASGMPDKLHTVDSRHALSTLFLFGKGAH